MAVTAVFTVALRRAFHFLVLEDVLTLSSIIVVHFMTQTFRRKRVVPVFIVTGAFFAVSSATLGVSHMMVILHETVNLNDAMLVPLDLFIDMISLDLGQNLNHSLLESSPCHQRSIVGRCKSFLSDLYLLNGLHSISNLVVKLVHEVANSVASSTYSFLLSILCIGLKDQNVSLLLENDLVEYFDARCARVQIVVEVTDVFARKSIQLLDFEEAGHCLFEGNFIRVIQLHEKDVQTVDDDQAVDGVISNDISNQEVAHNCKVDEKQH